MTFTFYLKKYFRGDFIFAGIIIAVFSFISWVYYDDTARGYWKPEIFSVAVMLLGCVIANWATSPIYNGEISLNAFLRVIFFALITDIIQLFNKDYYSSLSENSHYYMTHELGKCLYVRLGGKAKDYGPVRFYSLKDIDLKLLEKEKDKRDSSEDIPEAPEWFVRKEFKDPNKPGQYSKLTHISNLKLIGLFYVSELRDRELLLLTVDNKQLDDAIDDKRPKWHPIM